ncbi:MAG: acyl-ACP desaturase [Planctomyces sp.]|nr:acyl-ACP desaturase [Planctomyces sp.]
MHSNFEQNLRSGMSVSDEFIEDKATTAHDVVLGVCHEANAAESQRRRQQCVDRGIASLYRWYVARSQPSRQWNADTDFRWKEIRRDLPEDILAIVQGFYAVEQFIPDYAAELTGLLRKNYGRSQFYLKWGSEEARHADLWQNVLLASGYRTLPWLEDYSRELRSRSWELPFDDPLEMLIYTVLQERATQINYARLRTAVSQCGQEGCHDPVLELAAKTIAIDEVAHFEFFLSATILHLYYFPERTLAALARVLAFFEMPAVTIVPDYEPFIEALYRRGLFGKKIYYAEVFKLICRQFGVSDVRKLDNCVKASRTTQLDAAGLPLHPSQIFDFETIQETVISLFQRLGRFEQEAGIYEMFQTELIPFDWGKAE